MTRVTFEPTGEILQIIICTIFTGYTGLHRADRL